MSDIFQRRAEAKAAVSEIETKKLAHLRKIEEKEAALLSIRSTREDARAAAASAFFRNETLISPAVLETEIRNLYDQLAYFDIELKTRKKAVAALEGEYRESIFAKIKPRDDANKQEMAEAMVKLARCCRVEIDHEREMLDADTTAHAEYRPMRPNSIGLLNDPNSFVSLWLRELAEFYPHVKVRES